MEFLSKVATEFPAYIGIGGGEYGRREYGRAGMLTGILNTIQETRGKEVYKQQ